MGKMVIIDGVRAIIDNMDDKYCFIEGASFKVSAFFMAHDEGKSF